MADQKPDIMMKIMTIGEMNVGKSAFLEKYVTGEFRSAYTSTVGIDFRRKNIEFQEDDDKPVKTVALQMWDTAGQERYRTITRAYYRGAKGFLLVFSLTSKATFDNLDYWLKEVKQYCNVENPKIVVCGNKADLEAERQVDAETVNKRMTELGLEYYETSANSGKNQDEAVRCLVHMMLTGKSPDESDDEEVDEEAVKKEVDEKVKLEDKKAGNQGSCWC